MKIKIALDWTPNANHAGIYLALLNGWYKEADLDIELLIPQNNEEEIAPIEKLFRKQASLAIAPCEMVVKSHLNGYKELIAIAALLQGNPSSFGTIKNNGIDSIKKLKGKTYAALEIPFEKPVISQLTGGDYNSITPKILDVYKLLFEGKADFVWLFKNIEAVEAKLKGLELNLFDLEEAEIPYGPCCLIIAHSEFVADYSFILQKFFDITSKAYKEVVAYPERTTETLYEKGKDFFPDKKLLFETIKASCLYYLTSEHKWGTMEQQRWENYLDWLEKKGQIRKSHFNTSVLFTNEFFKF